MNNKEPNYVEIFNDFFGQKPFSTEDHIDKTETKTIYGYDIMSLFVSCRFHKVNVNIMSKPYSCTCNISFKNLSKQPVKELFDAKNYNYDLIDKTINELFKIGKSYNFYKGMTPIKNNRLEDSFMRNGYPRGNSSKNLTKLTLSGFLTDKYTDDNPLKKISKQHLNFYLSENNEIFPIITLFFPYSSTADFICFINLHPSQRELQIKNLIQIKKDFTAELEEQLNTVLKRKLKLKKEDLITMTTQEKLNYIPVIEMTRI
jgi:hypothetical protein